MRYAIVGSHLMHFVDHLLSLNILVWGIALTCHVAAKSFGALVVCRIFLAICESAIMPAFMIVTSMFYTRGEQTLRVGYWCKCPFVGV